MRTGTMAALTAALATVVCVGLAGCSASEDAARPDRRSDTSGTATTTTAAEFVSTAKDAPGTLVGLVGAKADSHDTTCTQTDGRWTATGKVTNPTEVAARYRVYVSFVDDDTTVGLAQTDVASVEAGGTSTWSASVAAPGTGLRCILRVERAAA